MDTYDTMEESFRAKELLQGCEVVGLPLEVIQMMFRNKPCELLEAREGEGGGNTFVVRFNMTGLFCFLDKEDRCESCFLFTDDYSVMRCYIGFCNLLFPYDYHAQGWVTPGQFVYVYVNERFCGLCIDLVKG